MVLYPKFGIIVKFGPMVFFLFGRTVKFSVLWFFIYAVLWSWSSGPARNFSVCRYWDFHFILFLHKPGYDPDTDKGGKKWNKPGYDPDTDKGWKKWRIVQADVFWESVVQQKSELNQFYVKFNACTHFKK